MLDYCSFSVYLKKFGFIFISLVCLINFDDEPLIELSDDKSTTSEQLLKYSGKLTRENNGYTSKDLI